MKEKMIGKERKQKKKSEEVQKGIKSTIRFTVLKFTFYYFFNWDRNEKLLWKRKLKTYHLFSKLKNAELRAFIEESEDNQR